jgi:hypothetical protein
MRYILTILITLFAVTAIAQPTPTYTGSYTQMSYNRGSVGALRLQYIPRGFYPFPTFDTLGTIWVDSAQTRGLFYHNGTVRLRLASVPYVDSIAASIEAGSVDSSIYSTVTRLSDSLHSLRDYVDSNNTIIYSNIATLQSDVVTIDSAVGVAFGAISNLYDTLPYYVDTAMLNDSLQAIKAAYVPYTGATTNVNLGAKSLTTNKVLTDTLGAKSSMGIHLHGTGGTGIMVGAGGGGTITFDDYPTTTTGDSVLSTNSSGGLLRYNLKGKLANYWLKTDTGRAATNIVTGGALNKVRDSLAALIPSLSGYVPYTGATTDVDLGTHAISARTGVINKPSGSGTALSVTKGGSGEALTVTKSSGSGNAMSVSGGVTQLSELHTTTAIADAYISSAATWNAKGTVSSIQLVGGTGVTITPTTAITTSGTYTISATGGGSSTIVKANEFNMLYKANGDTTIRGTTKVRIDTTDMRLEFAFDTTTTAVTTDPHGGVKMWGSNRMGMGAVRINDTVSIPAALQRAINAQTTSSIIPFNVNNPPSALSYTGSYNWFKVVSTTYGTPVTNAYSATIQHLNYPKAQFATGAGANATAAIRTGNTDGACGLVCGNTKFSGGGGRGTFTFAFPTYASTQRIMIGYSERIDALSGDPSAFLTGYSNLMIIKDATDSTLFFSHNSGAATTTKVNTGIKPNNEDVYRLTVYIAPNSTFYAQLEVMSKTAAPTVVTINPITNVPPVGDKLVQQQAVNNGTVGGIIVYGFIQHMEEVY